MREILPTRAVVSNVYAMTTNAQLLLRQPLVRTHHAESIDNRQTLRYAHARHGRSPAAADAGARHPPTQLRGTPRLAYRPSMGLATEPGAGAPAPQCAPAGTSLRRRHRLSHATRARPHGRALFDSAGFVRVSFSLRVALFALVNENLHFASGCATGDSLIPLHSVRAR